MHAHCASGYCALALWMRNRDAKVTAALGPADSRGIAESPCVGEPTSPLSIKVIRGSCSDLVDDEAHVVQLLRELLELSRVELLHALASPLQQLQLGLLSLCRFFVILTLCGPSGEKMRASEGQNLRKIDI